MAKRISKTNAKDSRSAVLAEAINAADGGTWERVTLRDLADTAVVPFGEAYAAFQSPAHIPAAILNEAITAALGEALPDASLSPKDRIFDAAMNVFDALKPHRAALGGMLKAYRLHPVAGAPVMGALARFARVTLERAGISSDGIFGSARAVALARTLYLVLMVFAEDEEGLPRTMAALDTRLREAERWAKRLGWGKSAR